jgi:uncharacterized protein YneF (UPF0154 family)
MNKWAALAIWMVFVVVAVVISRLLFGEAARLERSTWVVISLVVGVIAGVVSYRRAMKRRKGG